MAAEYIHKEEEEEFLVINGLVEHLTRKLIKKKPGFVNGLLIALCILKEHLFVIEKRIINHQNSFWELKKMPDSH